MMHQESAAWHRIFAATFALALALPTAARGEAPAYSPYADREYPTRVYWGDTHLHTDLSLDARGFGVRIGPEEALRFARGEQIESTHGLAVRLGQPLDFLVVADHSDGLGTMKRIIEGDPALLTDPSVADWNQRINRGGAEAFAATMEVIGRFTQGKVPPILNEPALANTIWKDYAATSDRYNEPGRFTALIGYEWTSTPGGDNLHRVVIYRDAADKVTRMLPANTAQSMDPQSLWQQLAAYEQQTGGKVLAIPHNGNLSNGLMFALEDYSGNPWTAATAAERTRWEPVAEVTQIKGDGETHKLLSPDDEFADYETWDRGNLLLVPKKSNEQLRGEYAREALKRGLLLEQQLGVNPFQFGMIGATDSHTGLATAEEENFFGKHSGMEPAATRWNHKVGEFEGRSVMGWQQVSSGYAGVWARANTREALWDAIQRKEVYATTGPRITVRFFAGWDFAPADAQSGDPALAGYARGVPMGGELRAASAGAAPRFLVAAMRDPRGANLDRVQIIKGWVEDGATKEKVHDVVWSDAAQRRADAAGKIPAVGSTVDVANARWSNTIGDPELVTVWSDPDFDAAQPAFYYARVIEIPTPRWTAYEQQRFGLKMSAEVPMQTQERAYTSPIWYTPE